MSQLRLSLIRLKSQNIDLFPIYGASQSFSSELLASDTSIVTIWIKESSFQHLGLYAVFVASTTWLLMRKIYIHGHSYS